jgi:rfaE bifunctional protein kinase chain/domain
MNPDRFFAITDHYPSLRIAVLGDFCLDRYLEIDPAQTEASIETGLPVHNVINVRAQPGGAGTIVNNLAALGIGHIYPIGFAGEDGEGFELCRALERRRGVALDFFIRTCLRRTFTYTKPLLMLPGKKPVELSRFDLKNSTPTPALVQGLIIGRLREIAPRVDAIIVLDQAHQHETGVVTQKVLAELRQISASRPDLLILADSRRGLWDFPSLCFKMNYAELSSWRDLKAEADLDQVKEAAVAIADENSRSVFVTLAERGIIGITANCTAEHLPALPLRGEIDVVGAGDAVTANLVAAMLAGANLHETLEMANAAASVVIHKLGTTGTANAGEIEALVLVQQKD